MKSSASFPAIFDLEEPFPVHLNFKLSKMIIQPFFKQQETSSGSGTWQKTRWKKFLF